ncbi:TPA: DUF362 domain-containing protein [Candidatus Poribacteria bacterium]|jgi:uncharacterized Fe-S center protein|nr:DUF362 domain-containing protein [Candidatus Poribacteria bacterium]HIB92101.1 DUF362 domain-containing protein [Candidatus Poribacteria bacterium]HIC01548.1 DUF362 domain-containing protein [Candidatus Poribacteria bacterium]HIC18476.1 DUF362 domain-containing protein [Candidatus Poribacteria bacterium]HIM11546.1 DUF362 domain-containing protein [Candidatus Poribacteria bacterium]
MKDQPKDLIIEQIQADCNEVTQGMINRRNFLQDTTKSVIATGIAASAVTAISNLAHAQSSKQIKMDEEPPVPVVEAMSDNVWKEGLLDPQIVGDMIDQAMIKLTDRQSAKEAWKDFVLPDDIVAIKINPIGGKDFSTHHVIIDKIVEGLYGVGVLENQIIVWDRFEKHLVNAGYQINQSDKDVRHFASDSDEIGYDEAVFYETENDIEIRREGQSTRSNYSKILTQIATVIINVPVMKHHAITGVSGCLKNITFGGVDNTRRFHSNPLNCDPAVSEIFAHKVIKDKLVLNIVDALLAGFDGGPIYDPNGVWKHGRIFASTDPVILDQIALEAIDEKRTEMGLSSIKTIAKHIRSASKAKLGTNNLDDADLRDVKI